MRVRKWLGPLEKEKKKREKEQSVHHDLADKRTIWRNTRINFQKTSTTTNPRLYFNYPVSHYRLILYLRIFTFLYFYILPYVLLFLYNRGEISWEIHRVLNAILSRAPLPAWSIARCISLEEPGRFVHKTLSKEAPNSKPTGIFRAADLLTT